MSSDPVGRVNYFDGEALLTKDFQDEQAYHVQMREWLSQGVYKPGVVRGLDVQWHVGDTQVTVTSGRALDRNGRLIVLTDDAAYTPTLQDGKQNYLTISFKAELGDSVSEPYGDGYKRWIEQPLIDCKSEFDPDGDAILLAVIGGQGGAIQAVYYYFGRYERRHAGAVLGDVQFSLEGAPSALRDPYIDGTSTSQAMAIAAQRDVDTGAPYLAIEGPEIRIQGPVIADGDFTGNFNGELSGQANLTGAFNGTFTGNGAGLTGVRATGYWQQGQGQDQSLFYMTGNVGINDRTPNAVLSVGQPVHSRIGEGLVTVTAMEQGVATLQGYQTNFTSELVGKILQFGVVLKQQAVIASVDSEERLTLMESFPLGLGPTRYSYVLASQGSDTEVPGQGLITPDGKTVTASANVQFQTQAHLKGGDMLVIDRFVPDQQVIESKKELVSSDTAMTLTEAFSEDVTDSAYMFSTEPGRWATGAGTITSSSKTVTGTGTNFKQLPANATIRALRALDVASAPQTWRVEEVTDTTHLKMRKISVDEGSPLLPMMSSFAQTSWPLMKVGGGTQPSIPPALTVVQNNGSVPNTVAINVDDQTVKLDSTYALQVNGPTKFEGGSLEIDGNLRVEGELDVDGKLHVDGDLDVDGDVHVAGLATIAKDLSAGGNFDVKGTATIGDLLTASKDLRVDGGVTVVGASNFQGAMTTVDVSTTGAATFSRSAEIESGATFTLKSGANLTAESGATFDVRCPATFDVTSPPGSTAVTAGSIKVTGDTEIDGKLTLDDIVAQHSLVTVHGSAEITKDLTVDGNLVVTGAGTVLGNLTVEGEIIGKLQGSGQKSIWASSGMKSWGSINVQNGDHDIGPQTWHDQKADADGILILSSTNGEFFYEINSKGTNWFSCCFIINIGASSYYATATGMTFGKGWGTMNTAAYMCLPIAKDDDVVIQYHAHGQPFHIEAFVNFMPFA